MKLTILTIRNLTTTPIELKSISRSDEANVPFVSRCCGGSIFAKRKTYTSDQHDSNSGRFSKNSEVLSIPIEPFESKTTNIEILPNELVRYTFRADGKLYQVENVRGRSSHSVALNCLSPTPHSKFTAIFHPEFAHLAIFTTTTREAWMSELEDDLPLSALSIPGTHNSATCYTAFPSVRCQAVDVKTQLQNGIRFLDIRVQPEKPLDASKDHLILVHSAFPVSLTGNKYLRDIIKVLDAFLDVNPSETVILSIKREGVGKSTDEQLCKILHDHYARDRSRWFTENRIPTLGEVRKKIVLVRRFCLDNSLKGENMGNGWGIDAEFWPDNCVDGSCAGGNIRIQDFYELSAAEIIHLKIRYSIEQLIRSAQSIFDLNSVASEIPKQPFFVNFLSASNFWSTSCWPERVAAKVNPQIVAHLCLNHHRDESSDPSLSGESKKEYMGNGSTGIVVCDWAGKNGNWDLINCIIGMNARLQMI
ncbi:1-phosphatidylinositol phosphodiesterase [Erysiphe neolycopersici]|uniref:1-phosphatidylinositol phosphodiesterase n=1 Tax=Erysiphe neolycopersici TaxID=212602 RepID=A0A420I5M3_9PEZI|nr:1-phosphatidylinositol phosphodiesterase [Erysiphe neolycopersici]